MNERTNTNVENMPKMNARRRKALTAEKAVDAMSGMPTVEMTPAEMLVEEARWEKRYAEDRLANEGLSMLSTIESYGTRLLELAATARSRFDELGKNKSAALYDKDFYSALRGLQSYADSIGRRAVEFDKAGETFRREIQPWNHILNRLAPEPKVTPTEE